MEPQTDKPLPQPNGYALSTEEESSSEATTTQDAQVQDKASATTFKNPPSAEEKEATVLSEPQECVNGDESLDSIDSDANEKESGSIEKEITAAFRGREQAGSEDVVQECKANDCTPAADEAASDGVHEKEGTVLSSSSQYVQASNQVPLPTATHHLFQYKLLVLHLEKAFFFFFTKCEIFCMM